MAKRSGKTVWCIIFFIITLLLVFFIFKYWSPGNGSGNCEYKYNSVPYMVHSYHVYDPNQYPEVSWGEPSPLDQNIANTNPVYNLCIIDADGNKVPKSSVTQDYGKLEYNYGTYEESGLELGNKYRVIIYVSSFAGDNSVKNSDKTYSCDFEFTKTKHGRDIMDKNSPIVTVECGTVTYTIGKDDVFEVAWSVDCLDSKPKEDCPSKFSYSVTVSEAGTGILHFRQHQK